MEFKPWRVVWPGTFEALPLTNPKSLRFLIVCAAEMQRRAMEAGTGLGLEGSEQVTRGSLRRCQRSDLALAGQPRGGVKLPSCPVPHPCVGR